jgi:hypothetical protein
VSATIKLHVAPAGGEPRRVVLATTDSVEHRDRIDTDSATSRKRFIRDLAEKLGVNPSEIAGLDSEIVSKADSADDEAEVQAGALPFPSADNGDKRQSQATVLVGLAQHAGAKLWNSTDEDAYATIPVRDHHEHHPVRNRPFRRWLARLYHQVNQSAPGGQAIQDAIGVLEGKALFDGDTYRTWVRVAEHEGAIFVDLANDKWQCIQIDLTGWRLVDEPPVRFRRPKAMESLPVPIQGGSLGMMRKYVNVTDEHWPLIAAFMVACLRPRGPYPVLCLHGEQGSGKSTQARAIRSVIDPNLAPIRSEPREPRDLMIAANNGWLVALDNLSHLPVGLSDCMCRLSTGGGFSTRTLYENDEETIFNSVRPSIITGIEEVATRSDLIDRSLAVMLPRIPDQRRTPEAKFWADFERDRPLILGALFDAIVVGLQQIDRIALKNLPRMADFAAWAVACEPGIGFKDGQFLAAYEENRSCVNEVALESSPVTKVLLEFTERGGWSGDWSGTATELLGALNEVAGHNDQRRRPEGWPKRPHLLSGELRRLAPNLRKSGVEVEFDRQTGGRRTRIIAIRAGTKGCVPSVPSVPPTMESSSERDDSRSQPWTSSDVSRTQENSRLIHAGTLGTHRDAEIPTQSGTTASARTKVRV